MRINVYAEELTRQVTHVVKRDIIGDDGQLVTFHGVRIWLAGPDTLHHTEHDDDRPAITYWFAGQIAADQLERIFIDAAQATQGWGD